MFALQKWVSRQMRASSQLWRTRLACSQGTYGRRGRKRAACATQLESLEARQVMAATPIAGLSDEFTDAASINNWSEVNQTEGWGARGAQLNQWTVNANGDGQMVMQPHTVVWYADWRGPLVYKEVTGDFVVTTRMTITDRDNIGGNDADNVPGDGQFSLGGLMIRTPRAITNGAADWQPGSQADDGTNNGENYVFLSMGYTSGSNNLSFEVKTTRNSNSVLEITPLAQSPNEVELQIARVGNSIIALHRRVGEANWTVHRRYSRPDMPATMQVGMVTYSDWEKANDLAPVVHNGSVLAPGQIVDPSPWQPFNPDLTASFGYTRFARPDVPAALVGANLALPAVASDTQLLSFLGNNANIDPNGNPNPDPDPDPNPVDQTTHVGVNLSHVVDWDPAMIFKDAFNRARPWGTRAENVATGETTWQFFLGEGPTLQVNEQGWVASLPTWTASNGTVYQQQASTVVFTDGANQPAGIYRAEWDGNGELIMPFVTETGTMPSGRHYALVNMPFDAHFGMEIHSTDPANPIRNIDLWMPDYNGESFVGDVWQPGSNESPFHPQFLQRVADFDTLRFMDWMNTNNSDIVTWDDVRTLNDASQSDGDLLEYFHTNGVALEYLIELSNTIDANPWFNMPHQADDDFVRNFATMVRDTLDPDLTVYVEWSNELWNSQFAVNGWIQQQMTLPQNAGLDFFQVAGQEIRRDFNIWSEVFAGHEDRLVRVVAGQQANSWLTEQILINANGQVDAVSSSAYAGISYDMAAAYTATTTPDDIINDLLNISIPWASARLQEHNALIQQYELSLGRDLQFVTYESGSHVFGAPNPLPFSPALNAALEAMHSPRMYDVYQTLLGEVREAGVDLYNEFNFTSHDGASYFGTYGLLHDMTTPLSEAHQLRSLLDFAASQNDDDPPPLPVNHAPVFAAIAPISISEAGALNVVVSATDSDLPTQTLTYSLGANAPSGLSINSATGEVTWLAPDSSGADLYLVTVIATDNGTPALSGRTTLSLTVRNVAPTADVAGSTQATVGMNQQFVLTASDPSAADQAAGFTFRIDWNGDGTVDQTVVGQSGLAVAHLFATAGAHNVRVTATDRDGAISAADSLAVNVTAQTQAFAELRSDPAHPGQQMLYVAGTPQGDQISVSRLATGQMRVIVGNRRLGDYNTTNRILVEAGAGNDRVTVSSNVTIPVELDGGAGNDTLNGGSANDLLWGESGNDSLIGGNGDDILIGGDGNDTVNGMNGNDSLFGNAGSDSLRGGNDQDSIHAGDGADSLYGENGNDVLLGEGGNDYISGGNDQDIIDGGDGHDVLNGDNGHDAIRGGLGNDTLNGAAGRDTLLGGAGNDSLLGGNDDDTLLGESGNDVVNGQSGFDRITAGGNGSTRTTLDRAAGALAEIDDLFAYDFDAILIGMLLPAIQKVR